MDLDQYAGESFSISYGNYSNRHRLGVNVLLHQNETRLLSGGRDGIIRQWDISQDMPENGQHKTGIQSTTCRQYYEGHCGWISALVTTVSPVPLLISGSYDTTIKLWNLDEITSSPQETSTNCIETITAHYDYIKALVYSETLNYLFSSSLDGNLFVWDLNGQKLIQTLAQTTEDLWRLNHEQHVEPMYCLAECSSQSLILSGSTDRNIYAWDPRQKRARVGIFYGHEDTIRCLAVHDLSPNYISSGSSDRTIRQWDLRKMNEEQVLKLETPHLDSIWSLQFDTEDSNMLYSAGRDQRIYETNVSANTSTLLGTESSPVLSVSSWNRSAGLWAGTTASSMHQWHVMTKRPTQPRSRITGDPAIIQYKVLHNSIDILTKTDDGKIQRFHVYQQHACSQTCSSELAKMPLEKIAQESPFYQMCYTPSWYSINISLGRLILVWNAKTCISAKVHVKDLFSISRGGSNDHPNSCHCISQQPQLIQAKDEGGEEHQVIDLSEALLGGIFASSECIKYRFEFHAHHMLVQLCLQITGKRVLTSIPVQSFDSEDYQHLVPEWIEHWIFRKDKFHPINEPPRVSFFLQRRQVDGQHHDEQFPQQHEKLSATYYSKIKTLSSYLRQTHPNNNATLKQNSSIQFMCKSMALDDELSLGAIYYHIWKDFETPLVIHYICDSDVGQALENSRMNTESSKCVV